MPARIEFHEEAGTEYDAAFDWYFQRSPDAAVKFDSEVERAIEEILKTPQRWAIALTELADSCCDGFLSF